MKTASIVFSLLFVALFDFSECAFGLTGAAGGAALAALALGGAAVLGAATVGVLAGRGRRRGRGRRSVEELQQEEAVWAEVAAADASMCAQKLICLLEAEQELDDDEQLLVAFVGNVEGSPAQQEVFSKLPYEAAGWLGKYQGPAACEAYFGQRCGFDKRQMMSFITDLWSQAKKDTEAQQTTTTSTTSTTTEAPKTA